MEKIRIFTVSEVAELLHVTTRTVYTYIKTGKIQAVKFGKSWRITEEALKESLSNYK